MFFYLFNVVGYLVGVRGNTSRTSKLGPAPDWESCPELHRRLTSPALSFITSAQLISDLDPGPLVQAWGSWHSPFPATTLSYNSQEGLGLRCLPSSCQQYGGSLGVLAPIALPRHGLLPCPGPW